MNLKLSFSWVGLVVFALPMLINIAYAVFPPAGAAPAAKTVTRWVEAVEQISRIAYLLALVFLCAAVWMGNLPAAVLMAVFGAAHLTVSVQSFR